MQIFHLRDRLIQEYAAYASGFVQIRDQQIKAYVDQCLAAGVLWPEPLIQLNPSFEPGEWIDELVQAGLLQPECRRIFRKDKHDSTSEGLPLRLHRHQAAAIRIAKGGHNYILTTGTGSGKSLAYIVPIVDHVLRRGSGRGIQALIVYPMNALANSQYGELRSLNRDVSRPSKKDSLPATLVNFRPKSVSRRLHFACTNLSAVGIRCTLLSNERKSGISPSNANNMFLGTVAVSYFRSCSAASVAKSTTVSAPPRITMRRRSCTSRVNCLIV